MMNVCTKHGLLVLTALLFGLPSIALTHADDKTQDSGKKKWKVLFLCTGNSCRSQMAEGWAEKLLGDRIEAYSAGIETHGLNPNAVKVMKEAGVDITKHRSKLVKNIPVQFDYVVAVCPHANENRPMFPASTKVVFHPFDDPPKLAKQFEKEEDQLNVYRKVRDEIKTYIAALPETLKADSKSAVKKKPRGRLIQQLRQARRNA